MVGFIERSILAAELIFGILILRAVLLRKLPKITFQIMWAIVALRLLLPFSLLLPKFWSIPNVFVSFAKYEDVTPENTGIRLPLNAESRLQVDEKRENRITSRVLGDGTPEAEKMPEAERVPETEKMPEAERVARSEKTEKNPMSWQMDKNKALQVLWLAGAVLFFSYFAISHVRCRKRYAAAIPVELPGMDLGSFTKRKIQIKVSDRLPSPLTYGIFSPVILLPKITDWENKEQLRLVLAHEAIHIRRWDVLYKWAMALAVCLHWFNPFVWLMFFLAGRDMELSCDEAVIRRLQHSNRADYALALLYFEEKCSVSLGFSRFSGNAVKERVELIMKWNKTTMASAALAVLLVAGTTTVFAAPKENGSNAPENIQGKDASDANRAENLGRGENPGRAENTGKDYEIEPKEVKQYLCEPSYYTAEEFEEIMQLERKEIEETLAQGLLSKEEADQMLSKLEDTYKEIQDGRKVEKASPVYYADGTPVVNSKGEQLYAKASDIKRMNEELLAKAQINSEVPVESVAEDTVYIGQLYPGQGIPAEAGEDTGATVTDKYWYTYEEYAEYVEQQKKEYASMLGEWSFNSIDGWYEWTEEMIAEACRLLDEELEFIKKGGFISRPTEWEDGGTLIGQMMMSYYVGDIETTYAEEIQVSEPVVGAIIAKQEATTMEGGFWDSGYLEDYKAYGITADKDAQYYLYQGKPIAGFIDKGFRLLTDGIAKEAGGVYVKVMRDDKNTIKNVEEITKNEFEELSGLTVD